MECSITIKNFDSDGNKEVTITEVDNNIHDLLRNCGHISYTNIEYDPKGILSEAEKELVSLKEIHELREETNVVNAQEFLKVVKKLYYRLRTVKSKSLLKRIDEIKEYELAEEEKERRIKSEMTGYFHFEFGIGKFIGVIETAAIYDLNIQILVNYY